MGAGLVDRRRPGEHPADRAVRPRRDGLRAVCRRRTTAPSQPRPSTSRWTRSPTRRARDGARHDDERGDGGRVRALVARSPVPVVLDADGLNAFTGEARRPRRPPLGGGAHAPRRRVRPPDGREAARARGRPASGTSARSRPTSGAVALLKGSRTLIAAPGRHTRASTRPAARARDGGLRRRADRARSAACWPAASGRSTPPPPGAYLHGLAGTLAGRARGRARSRATWSRASSRGRRARSDGGMS